MSATATPPQAPPPGRPGHGARLAPPPEGRRRAADPARQARPLLSPPVARLVTLTALAAYAALRWGTLVEPYGGGRMLLLLAFALAAGTAVGQLARLPPLAQAPAALVVVVAWAALSALAAGVSASLVLDPAHWDDLAAGMRQGIEQLPRVLVPYSQPDVWPRIAILLGGALLLALGCVIALGVGRPGGARFGLSFRDGEPFGGGIALRLAAATPLIAASIVPAAIMEPDAPALLGVVLFALLAAFLWLERLPRAYAPAATVLLLVAGLGGVVATPWLDREEPWVDAQALVEDLDTPDPARFDWSQSYGPLDWPRDGREVLRVQSRREAYWKAQNLDGFDGVRWTRSGPPTPVRPDGEVPREALVRRGWRTDVHVTLRSFSTSEVVGAGTTLGIQREPTTFSPGISPGTWTSDEPLEPGDGYIAQTIVPRPRPTELQGAGTDYPGWIDRYLLVGLPQQDEFAPARWAPGGGVAAPTPFGSPRTAFTDANDARLASSPYGPAAALAAQLAAGQPTPYAYVQAVLAYLRGDEFRYDENPPRRSLPLDAFLFRDRIGYCQQFAGAAALLLRLGGVPTRVAAGFTSGSRDGARDEWVVRDYDAHAWVEVWFPRIGWVRFDPTPSTAPALSGQAPETPAPRSAVAPSLPRAPRRDSGVAPRAAAPAQREDGSSLPLALLALGGAIVLGGGGLLLRRALRPPVGADALLAELRRALRRTGRPPSPRTTLAELEQRFHDSPDAAAYLRAIRLARFGGEEPEVTARQRRALRNELARGLGLGGRLRALFALPPRSGR
ncbi:DUF3488 and transglutaminase-like domain-containing protein [Conexibacter woesei]|uniref:Transglutaminase domain protein n=1 Tax=Conexibacter woesei (strain DSM 14684 / CCUG 47730 / CIP 108061 / JCM 11494 / NBRC 100937 / ID131577) TaxID=469383 RepID=D3FE17_CONWI|nr:transglutaminase domain-containing protein [Conexibacter woesei]ADB51633.1 transglutaminase domain protein [Conexibacter woesei DSM 14684]